MSAARQLLAAVLVLGALPQLWLAVSDQGMFWPDEIYQSLEQAHRFAFGFGVVPWEFAEGARSWLLPGVLGLYWKLLALLGMHDGLTLVIAAKLLVAAASVAATALAMLLAHRHGGLLAALLAGTIVALHPAVLLLGHRALSEVVSAPLLLGAVLLAGRTGARAAAAAGLVAGLAVFVRYQNGLALPVLLAMLLHAQRFEDAKFLVLGACAAAVLGGALDWLTWGAPFAAFLNYLTFNCAHSADRFGSEAPWFYFSTALSVTGPALWALLLGFAVGARRLPAAAAIVVLYVLAHSLIPHKEFRFLYPVLPLTFAVAATGLAALLERARRPALLAGGLALLLGASLSSAAASTTFGAWGVHTETDVSELSPWHANEGAHRLLGFAGTRPDTCGVWVQGIRAAWTGGFTYLHRNVSYAWGDDPQNADAANYIVRSDAPLGRPIGWPRPSALPAGYVPVARSRGWLLYRREGGCEAAANARALY